MEKLRETRSHSGVCNRFQNFLETGATMFTRIAIRRFHAIPLTEPLPGLPKVNYSKPYPKDAQAEVTVLSNGLKVASERKFGHYCIAGVAIKAGSRHEQSYPSGISHFIERSAFKSTEREKFSLLGGNLDCQGSRDLTIYAVSLPTTQLETGIDLLGGATLRPKFCDVDIEETANRIAFELEDISCDPERKVKLNEMIHQAAYGDKTLGLPKICPDQNLSKMNPALLFNFLKHHYTPDRMVLAAVGVDHQALVDLAQKYFVDCPPVWVTNPNIAAEEPHEVIRPASKYVGGLVAVEEDLSNVSLGPTPLPNLVHLQVGFEVCSHLELDEFVIVCVMNMLMGGGGSFSAGGPGKGMFTRLFTNVLNRYHWVHSSSAHNLSYDDTGIFYIQSSCDPSQLKDLVDIVIHEFRSIVTDRMSRDELDRAKKQLISMLWLNLEISPIIFEDIARQVLSTGFRRQPRQLIEKIEKVTEDDIKRVASKMLSKAPTVTCLGDLKNLPSYEYIKSRIQVH